MCQFCARGASVTRWRARAEVRGGEPMFLGMGSSFYEIWVSNSVGLRNFFFFGQTTGRPIVDHISLGKPHQIREL